MPAGSQTSENYNLGFTLQPLEAGASTWITGTSPRRADLAREWVELAAESVDDARSTKVIRNPAIPLVYNGVNVGSIVGLNVTYVNNASLESAGYDFGVNNSLDLGGFGMVRSSLIASYQDTYKINGRDISGSRNARTAGGSFAVPWRATLRNVWGLGSHSVQSLLRYTDAYANDQTPNAGTAGKSSIEKFFTWDVSYSFDLGERFGLNSSQIAFGANNVMDKSPPYVPDGNHTLASMYDYSGRHLWLRLKANF